VLFWLRKISICFGGISARKFRDLLRIFALDITADRAALLTGLHHNMTLAFYRLLRDCIAEFAVADCPFRGQVELDDSYFGPTRQGANPASGKGAASGARCQSSASSNAAGACIARS
jgi:hypothetical protein